MHISLLPIFYHYTIDVFMIKLPFIFRRLTNFMHNFKKGHYDDSGSGMKGCDNMTKKKITDKKKIQVSKEEQLPEEEQLPTTEEHTISKPPASDTDLNQSPKQDFPIVGIGASAGGLAAFEKLFSSMPNRTGTGMAFVLVQHLDPNHKSILTDLIGRYTQMPVYEIKDGMVVQPECVYVIPPNHDLVLEYGTLQLLEPAEPRGHRLPIDLVLRSLAQSKQELAIGIILSGTGSDGTLGVRAIKAEGGMVMVQSPESSEYDGMPSSAITTGLADYVLTPAEMPAQLIAYVTQAFKKRPHLIPRAEGAMKKIFNLLRTQTGHDFSHYKPNTPAASSGAWPSRMSIAWTSMCFI